MPKDQPILIAGGGIGGLATAMGLAQKGFRSLVLERAVKLGEIGAGIQLGPNAFHAFDYLGVGDAARAMAVYIDNLLLMDAMSGAEITRVPLGEAFRTRFGNPYAVVHRGDLHGVFLRACEESPLVELRTSAEVVGYGQDDSGVTARLADGGTVAGRALVGADGLWSNVRRQVVGDSAPRVSGHTTYRSVIPLERMPEALRWNAATLWAGPKCHVVHYPLSGWKVFNLVVTYHNDAPEPVAGKPVPVEEVRRGFEHIHELPRRIIEQGSDWKLWVLCDRDPVLEWQDGRVVLLGDAAHPMMQYFAQGACMAMEDAVCLARSVEQYEGDVEAAFAAYRDSRVDRTARVQLQSRLIGDHIYHPAGGHAHLRNTMLGSMSPSDHYDALQWLYGGSGLAVGAAAVR
ncbi:3-hydroxybenzoate 6-hydroxylase [Tistlia consotensis]|uniref:3-hydroxybenzoate 6-hydroxylase n=1 Tax=Tistlia consotensis USBA 355 TaxID=560819 RepID=A0A1Y6CF58_9PROT|nr:3-hydroxybenzoate 6-monooxygenase [Tistlia consotensis]SMF51889.1 3-hydroxybenzoate 6-hydroxylase [Tistlia consotensis USBA 355]SNR83616.1 3-hydroxybenzoate 6-hydroxylase [Tistlia consotensis]